jgi:O-acetyl-ADP-ribose deacetylase (regulator of RNase III)
MHDIHLILVAPNAALCHAFQIAFAELPNVEVVHGYFEQLPAFDCMVSAANSFGLMDGGVDAAITNFLGVDLERRVQHHIVEEYLGEQPVGTSFILTTGHPQHPYLAHTPTMRVPMEIARTDNVYRAMWAMLLAVRQHNRQAEQPIKRIACPGLGTGTGRVPLGEAARQMVLAYRHFLFPPTAMSWQMADARQLAVRYGGDMGLHIPPETGI